MDGLEANEIAVELYHGPLSSTGEIERGQRVAMVPGEVRNGTRRFSAEVVCAETGRQGLAVRVLPKHPGLINPLLHGLVKWA
jgi:starch phosphorylase